MPKPLITTVIVSQVQTQLLAASINSVKSSSQILIVDTSGKLKDLKIPGVELKIVRYPEPITNFSKVRNWALKQVQTDWVLFIDSDEQLETGGLSQIIQILTQTRSSALAVWRRDIFLNQPLKFGEAGHQSLPRVFKKTQVKYWGAVHERPKVVGQTLQTNILLFHNSHASISEFISKISRYAQLVAKERSSQGLESLPIIWLKLLTFPWFKLFVNLIVKQGFRDGWRGIVYALVMSLHSLLVRIFELEIIYGQTT